MAGRGQVYFIAGKPGLARRPFVDASDSGGEAKQLEHRAALRPGVAAVAAADVVGGNAALAVGRPGKGR